MIPENYYLQLPITAEQRRHLWELEKEIIIKPKRKELKEKLESFVCFCVTRYITGNPYYELLSKNKEITKIIEAIELPNYYTKFRAAVREEATKRATALGMKRVHPDYYHDGISDAIPLPEPMVSVPGLIASFYGKTVGLEDDNIEKIFSKAEIQELKEMLCKLVMCQLEEINLLSEYESEAGNRLGKLLTWGDAKSIKKEWFSALMAKYKDCEDTKLNLQKLVEKDKNRKGSSEEINRLLCEFSELAKRCNQFKD